LRNKSKPLLPSSLLTMMAAALILTPHVSRSETPIKVFRFHVPMEPTSLDPANVQSADASYFLNNVMRGLYSYDNDAGLVEEGAKSCKFKTKLKLECELATDQVWSDGSVIVAEDYVRAFRRLVGSSSKNAAVELLKNLKNAKTVHDGKLPTDKLGISATNAHHLAFEFENPDPEFIYKLCSSVLVPVKADVFPSREKSPETITNGPYKVVSWTLGRRVRLESNPRYKKGSSTRPPVEILFLDDDDTAFNLYDQGELTFLRRLPTTMIPKMKKRVDFVQIPIARFDYLGFGPELEKQPALREALAYSLDFNELGRIYDALGTPGCPSLPRHLMDDEPCIKFDLVRAKAAYEKVPAEARTHRYQLGFSKLGGDDIKKGAEWEQAQWKKNLSLTVDLEQTEQGVYLARLKENTPAIFRKGIGLERPTCLAALETFAKGGSENFVRFESEPYEKIVTQLIASTSVKQKKKLCSQGVKLLLDSNRILPLGRIHFTLLARPEFKGWSLNEMNQLDLSRLHLVP
jgi:oligopeptide transport system substrate-binding protein